jgi:phospholipid/cholesterol/gamma-HCH transport system ATP-binding protein
MTTDSNWLPDGLPAGAPDAERAAADGVGPAAAAQPFFEFIDVSKSFGSHAVLQDVSFDVRRGETVCIMGRSGVGKSVTLNLIMGFLKPDRGRIIAAGQDITDFNEEQLQQIHKKVTMVFQSGALFDSLTVGENVAFPLREAGELSDEEVDEVVSGLLHMLDLGAYRDASPSSLSTGYKRAVAIARALAARPEAILYDEPTTMVDPLMSHTIADLIDRVKKKIRLTSLVITHDTRLARKLADRIVFLHDSKSRFFGTVAELDASQDPVLRHFVGQDEMSMQAG